METMPQSDVLSPEQIYQKLKSSLTGLEGVDAEVLRIVEDKLLCATVDEKTSPKSAFEMLLKLAAERAEEKCDAPAAG